MDEEFSASVSPQETNDTSNSRKRKKRVRNWTASDRARHRVFEKGRREAFNERLMELARLLPNLSESKHSQELSKHVIVDESVNHHKAQEALIHSLRQDLDRTLAQQQQLLAEVNAWRQCMGFQPPQNQDSNLAPPPHIPLNGDVPDQPNQVRLIRNPDGSFTHDGRGIHNDHPTQQQFYNQNLPPSESHPPMIPAATFVAPQTASNELQHGEPTAMDQSGTFNNIPFGWTASNNVNWSQMSPNMAYQGSNWAPEHANYSMLISNG